MKRASLFLHWLSQRSVVTVSALVLLLLVVMLAAAYYAFNLPQLTLDRQQTLVFGPAQFSPASPSSLRVLVRDQDTGKPVADADVTIQLAPKAGGAAQTLYTGKTDMRGTAPISFTIPLETARDETLIVETSSGVGHDRVTRPVVVARNYKVLVTTDKPLYQPGQTIHLRALALGALDRVPARDQGLEFLVEDPKGNKLYRKTAQTSAYGVTSADFELADTLTSGTYKITASLGDTKSEKTVTVKPYVLPKFKVSVETDRGYYLPGEKVTGRIRADYFFGKPVAQSDVTLMGVVYDVARAETVNLAGKTDEEGVYTFAFDLPNYFAASGLDRNRADFGLEVSVTDQAEHTEQTSLALAIARDAILIDAVPESGKLVRDVENIVYILTALPDGSPVETTLTISGAGVPMAQTGRYGLAEIRLTPRGDTRLQITARDAQGRTATQTIALQTDTASHQVLLRPDHATYRVGETMHMDMFSSGSVGTLYLDLVKEGQTFSTRALDVLGGRASADVDVTAEMIGTVQVHAYQVERDGTITRDTRVVVVQQPSELNVGIQADHDTYRPGDVSHVTFNVTDAQGKGVASALGVTAVDESVFALAEQDPGFAKLYFMLTRELLDPKYQVKGFSLPEVVSAKPQAPPPDVRVAQDQSARAAWAQTTPLDFVLRANSQVEKRDAANQAQNVAVNNVTTWLVLLASLLPLALGGLVLVGLRVKKVLAKSLSLWLGAALAYCVLSPFLVGGIAILGGLFLRMDLAVILVALTAFAWIAAFAIVAGYAIQRRDRWIQTALVLLVGYLALLTLLIQVGSRATAFGEWAAFSVIIAYLVGLGAIVLMGAGLLVQKEMASGFAAILLALLFIPATILLALLPTAGPFLRAMGSPAIYIPPAYLTACAAAPPGMTSRSGNVFQDFQRGLGGTSAPRPAAVPTVTAAGQPEAGKSQEAPRLRQYFPETLYVNPQVITDENGRAAVDIPLADSITTWRLAATASSQRGELGAADAGVRVFQDFFVDLDLPVALTQNDEISVPVAVYNYLPQAQQVKLQVEPQPWFTLQDSADKTLDIASNDIDVVYFRIKAVQFGTQRLKVTALGEKMSDAIQREIRVYPDGKLSEVTQSNWLKGDTNEVVEIPTPAIEGASRVEVKIFPGVVSQVVDGLEGLLKMPYG